MRRFSRSPVLATAAKGQEARHALRTTINAQPTGTAAQLSFDGVADVTHAFADEGIAKLLIARLLDRDEFHALYACAVNDDVRAALVAALAPRRVMLFCVSHGPPRLLGAPEHLEETMLAAWALGSFSVPELAETLGIKAPAANNRVKALLTSGAVMRRRDAPARGGNAYRYAAPPRP